MTPTERKASATSPRPPASPRRLVIVSQTGRASARKSRPGKPRLRHSSGSAPGDWPDPWTTPWSPSWTARRHRGHRPRHHPRPDPGQAGGAPARQAPCGRAAPVPSPNSRPHFTGMPFLRCHEVNPAPPETCLPETDMPIWPTRPGTAHRAFCQVTGFSRPGNRDKRADRLPAARPGVMVVQAAENTPGNHPE